MKVSETWPCETISAEPGPGCNYSQLKANSLSAWSAVLITLLLQCSSIHGLSPLPLRKEYGEDEGGRMRGYEGG